MAKLSTKDFIASLKDMTILEVKELVDAMKEEFGVDPSAVAAAAAPGAAAADAAPSTVSVFLDAPGQAKVAVIKIVKELTGLGLKEAKDLVDGAPKAVKENIKPEEAEEIKAKLVEVGATASVR